MRLAISLVSITKGPREG